MLPAIGLFLQEESQKGSFPPKDKLFVIFFRIQTTIEKEGQGDLKLLTQKRRALDYMAFSKVICNKGQVHL